MDLSIALKTAKDPESSPEQLDALFGQDEEVDRLLARHPKALADLLEKLSHSSDKTTRKYVVGNPNATKEVLVKLAPQFPGDFFKNPAFDWLLIEQPNLMFEIGGGVLKNVLKRPECPASFLNWAAAHGSWQEKLAVAMNPAAPRAALEQLVTAGGELADAAKDHTNLQLSAESEDPGAELERQVKSELAELDEDEARRCWRRGFIGPAQWAWLDPTVRLDVLGFSEDHKWDERLDHYRRCYALIRDPALSMESLAILATDPDSEVRSLVATCDALTPEAWAILAMDPDHEIRGLIAARNSVPAEFINKLANDPIAWVRHELAGNSALPLTAFAILATDADYRVRGSLARNSLAPPFIIQELAKDADQRVRKIVSEACLQRNSNTHNYLPDQLARKSGRPESLKLRAACNPLTPISEIEKLARSKNLEIQLAVGANPSTPEAIRMEILSALAERAGLHGFYGFSEEYVVPHQIRQRAQDLSSARQWWHELELLSKREKLILPKCMQAADELLTVYRMETKLVCSNPTDSLVARMMGAKGLDLLEFRSTAVESACNLPDGKFRAARLLGLLSPHAPQTALIKRYRSVDWVERLAVAHNINAPAYVLSALKKDPHRLVAQQATLTADKQRALLPGPPSTVSVVTMEPVVSTLEVSPVTIQAFTAPCPNCKGTVKEDNGNYACCGVEGAASGCGFSFNKTQSGRAFKPAEVEVLLRSHKSGLLRGFISKAGKPFNAEMVLRFDEAKKTCRLVFDFVKDKKLEPVVLATSTAADVALQASLGACPKCGAAVHAHGTNYVCINSMVSPAQAVPSCDFKTGQVILQQAISAEQLGKLLTSGRTDLLDGFISARTQKAFKAMLVWDAKAGKVGFEFGSSRA